jgi:anaerobic magnesium-protoporphyrin IX monomethyl ester cyclase
MLSILVAHSYFLRFDQKQWERAKPYPPLATLHVASMLRRAGHQVAVFDAMLADGVGDYKRVLESVHPQLVLFYEDSFNFLSKMCLGRMRDASCEMIALAHARSARVIAVGSDATDAPDIYLESGADVVVIGEGLVTLLALVARLDSVPLLTISQLVDGQYGVATRTNGKTVATNGARPLPNPLYADPPAWDMIDLEKYRSMWRQSHGYFSLNMAASRGCSFRCNWCSKPIWGNQYLQRSPRDVAAEMAHLKRQFEPDHIWFADDIFGFRVDWVNDFAVTVHATNGSLPFTIQTRADLVSDKMAKALRAAGCAEVWIGAESGSQRILDAMNKGTTVEEILAARERLRAASIRVGFFIQLGYLGERLEDILATRKLIDDAQPDDIGVSVSYPLPGTKFYEQVKQQLGTKTHWQESNDLEMMFHGAYQSDFYRAVRDLLHEQVDLQKRNGAVQHEQRNGERQLFARRWQMLLAREFTYRSADEQNVAAGSR